VDALKQIDQLDGWTERRAPAVALTLMIDVDVTLKVAVVRKD